MHQKEQKLNLFLQTSHNKQINHQRFSYPTYQARKSPPPIYQLFTFSIRTKPKPLSPNPPSQTLESIQCSTAAKRAHQFPSNPRTAILSSAHPSPPWQSNSLLYIRIAARPGKCILRRALSLLFLPRCRRPRDNVYPYRGCYYCC